MTELLELWRAGPCADSLLQQLAPSDCASLTATCKSLHDCLDNKLCSVRSVHITLSNSNAAAVLSSLKGKQRVLTELARVKLVVHGDTAPASLRSVLKALTPYHQLHVMVLRLPLTLLDPPAQRALPEQITDLRIEQPGRDDTEFFQFAVKENVKHLSFVVGPQVNLITPEAHDYDTVSSDIGHWTLQRTT